MNYRILICDDDEDILSAVEIYLRQEGYQVIKAENGEEAVKVVQAESVHLVLLDIMMPVMDGIKAAVKIREGSNVPIIFLSAKGEDTDRILGLNMGADDYIVKPFNPVELIARVKSNLRRYSFLGGMEGVTANIYQTAGLALDDDRKKVTVDGVEVSLTPVEYKILTFLISHMDFVFSSGQIYEAVWDEPAYDVEKIISVHIRHIREKIEINPKQPKYLKVVYGMGYKVVKLPV